MKYIINILVSVILFTSLKAQYNNGRFVQTQQGLLNGSAVFTIEFWVKTTDNSGNDIYWQRPYLFGNETNGDNSGDFGITMNYGYIGMWNGISTLNSDQQFVSNSVRINDNFWHHIAVVNNGQTLNLYVDGNIIGSLIAGRQLITVNAPLTFGAATIDHAFAGNMQGNVNFVSQSNFGEARISNSVRYTSNFRPSQSFNTDGNSVAVYHLADQNYTSQPINTTYQNQTTATYYKDPNRPVVFAPNDPINDNEAQPAILYLNDSVSINGRLLIGKKDWSFSNEMYIRFFEGNSRKVKFYKMEEVKGFKMGDTYYEPKYPGGGSVVSSSNKKMMLRRLTEPGSRMGMYAYDIQSLVKNNYGNMEYKTTTVYFIQLPGSTDDKVYQFSDNKFTPHFDTRVSAIVQDKPALAEKIRSKNKDFFYAQITEQKHQLRVWQNIVMEYNQP
jgi:hypothetical protein